MIQFINAKLNLGLNIVRRRPDGYHDLETIFYPVGLYNGTPSNPEPFCDVLEITHADSDTDIFEWRGRQIACLPQDNLVCRAVILFRSLHPCYPVKLSLDKHLPDGAGLGGGSADASFTLRMLNELYGCPLSDTELQRAAHQLGADCPFFILNRPAFAEGVGEKLHPVEPFLRDKWCVIVKPEVYVSTREAFAGVSPAEPDLRLTDIMLRPIKEWKDLMRNDFEKSIFPQYPLLSHIKEQLYEFGAVYASMSGSGSSLYGIFDDASTAQRAFGFDNWQGMSVFICRL